MDTTLVLDCSAEDKASLIAMSMSRSEEARMVERAREPYLDGASGPMVPFVPVLRSLSH